MNAARLLRHALLGATLAAAATAGIARDTHDSITREVDALRDQVSGVSLDEEALNMLKFQRAYEANAKFFTVVDSLLDTLMNTYRP